MLRQGMFLLDRYEVLEQIGSGGMSDVYKAKCHKLNRLVAIKVLKEEFSSDANFVSKFKMEAQAAAGLSHPNIVSVYDVIDEGNIHYIVMELIEGITLKSYIAKKGKLEIKESIGIAIQVAQGMAAAHDQHIIHRDIKPQNMMISKDGKVKVADFGIARAVSAQTASVNAMGSVHYISPEQARGGYSDARSDIYSLGITMYEMVTGRLPFDGDNTVTVALAHLEDPMVSPRSYNPEIPVNLEKIILKCAEKKPERRYNSASEVISDLRRALLNPTEDFVKTPPIIDHMAHTVTIGHNELAQIKESTNQYREVQRNSVARTTSKKTKQEEDVNPHIEKLLTVVGVIVAILIVAVALFLFSRLGGLFNTPSKQEPESVTESTVAQSSDQALNDTQVTMPNVLGIPEDMARKKLEDNTLVMKVDQASGRVYSDEHEEGLVIEQKVLEGEVVAKYSTVKVVISKGPEFPEIDLTTLDLTSQNVSEVKTLLEANKLTMNLIEIEDPLVEKGKIVRFIPEKVKSGGVVTVYVSKGTAVTQVEVPSLVGLTEEMGIGKLEELGLKPGAANQVYHPTIGKGIIIAQSEAIGTKVNLGTAIIYEVSKGPEQKNYKYIAAIAESYPIKNVFGPGASTSSIQVYVRLKQTVNGQAVYTTLMEPITLDGDKVLPVNFNSIIGADGVEAGDVEIVDQTNDVVLKSYSVRFLRVE